MIATDEISINNSKKNVASLMPVRMRGDTSLSAQCCINLKMQNAASQS